MKYTQRLAIPEDKTAIAPLWQAFAQERSQSDPAITLKANFDFERYIEYQLAKPHTYCFVLEFDEQIVGFISIYIYDEAPPPDIVVDIEILENPFKPRRVGAVLGLYVQEQHRKPETIKLLIDVAIAKGEELKISDIDVLISIEQTGIQALLTRAGFTKSAIQYTKHFEISDSNLPNLHTPILKEVEISAGAIPLRDPKKNVVVKNYHGELVYLYPVKNAAGIIYKNSRGLPIYPTPIRDPQTEEWVLDGEGKLIVCPAIFDVDGEVLEYQEIPQFCPPTYELIDGKLQLKQDENGNYVFAEVEKDEAGKVVRSPDGKPIFKQS
ncbi:GNAT family N-acetyltransferase [Nostoc sp. FACHB-973]|nr:GNAT family N-acetyltransferase [Nostoc sp. FACHB-973]MBX9256536.1 GNAT family N-acetyltransferase [Desmonostoc muscorum CCALA 125]